MDNRSLETARFLVIRAANIGDLVCTTPLIHALRQRYPKARLCLLVNSYNRPVVENNPDIDEVYAYTKAKHRAPGQSVLGVYWDRLRLMRSLRRQRFDYAIIAGAHFLPRSLRLARAVKPRHILGFTEPGKRGAGHIDMGVPYTLPRPLHEVEDVFRLIAPLGIAGEPPAMQLRPEPAEVQAARRRLVQQRAPEDRLLIGVHLSSRKPPNRWPKENFIELIRRLSATHHLSFLLLWAPGRSDNSRHPGDDDTAAAIMTEVAGLPVIACPQGPLPQLIADLSLCDLVITSDGGALHIAAALGKPTLSFFGSTDPVRWRPWGVPYRVLQPVTRQAADISVDEAVRSFESLLTECFPASGQAHPSGTAAVAARPLA
ncbi:MAG: glycosyltransferase family 9 protein [Sulfuricaulis sp.]